MLKKNVRLLFASMAMALAMAMLVAVPSTAYAGTEPVTIDISLLTPGDGNLGDPDESEWSYDDTNKLLSLVTSGGNYTLEGASGAISIVVANGAEVALNDVHMVSPDPAAVAIQLGSGANLTIWGYAYIDANNTTGTAISCAGGNVIEVKPGGYLQADAARGVYSAGSLTVNAFESSLIKGTAGYGVTVVPGGTLTLEGFNFLTISGTSGAVSIGTSIQMGNRLYLILENKSGSSESHDFTAKDTATGWRWELNPESILAGGSQLTDQTITVTIPAGINGGISHIFPVCYILGSPTEYTTLYAAVHTALEDDTIVLINNVMEDYNFVIGTAPGIPKKLTIDMNNYSIDLQTEYIRVYEGHWTLKNGEDLLVKFVGADGANSTLDISVKNMKCYADSAVIADNGATINIVGYIEASENGIFAEYGAKVTVEGDIFARGMSCGTFPDAPLGNGVWAREGATVEVIGDIRAIGTVADPLGSGVIAVDDSTVTVKGGVTADYFGVFASGSSTITVEEGVCSYSNDGVFAENSSVSVTGAVVAYDGIGINAAQATVVVGGPVIATIGVYAESNSNVTVKNDIVADVFGVEASGTSVKILVNGKIYAWIANGVLIHAVAGVTKNIDITINGDITASYSGVYIWEGCEDNKVTVNGNIKAGYSGVLALGKGSKVFINGSILVTENTAPSGFLLAGAAAGFGAEVTIEGFITVVPDNYVALYIEPSGGGFLNEFLLASEDTKPSAKAGYLQYDDADELTPASFIWVRNQPTPGTGQNMTGIIAALAFLLAGGLLIQISLARRNVRSED